MPTPQDIVDKMLELAKVTSDDVVYDLGSGDGRIVITAAQKYGAHAVGVEINPDLYRQSSSRIKELGLDDRAHIMCEDMFDVSVRPGHGGDAVPADLIQRKTAAQAGTRAPLRDAHCVLMIFTFPDGIPKKSST